MHLQTISLCTPCLSKLLQAMFLFSQKKKQLSPTMSSENIKKNVFNQTEQWVTTHVTH